MATENSIYRILPEILSAQHEQPVGEVGIKDLLANAAVQIIPPADTQLDNGPEGGGLLKVWVVTLLGGTGKVQATLQTPTTAVGVQFWGNAGCGWAQIRVDNHIRWVGNTVNLRSYVEIYDLTPGTHVVTVETLGQQGQPDGGSEVRVAGFGYGVVGSMKNKVFLPIAHKSE